MMSNGTIGRSSLGRYAIPIEVEDFETPAMFDAEAVAYSFSELLGVRRERTSGTVACQHELRGWNR